MELPTSLLSSQASCSYTAQLRNATSKRVYPACQRTRHQQAQWQPPMQCPGASAPSHVQRASMLATKATAKAAAQQDDEEDDDTDIWDLEDNMYALQSRFNTEPDFDDPEWADKVTDWYDFWNHQVWDHEVATIEDEVDTSGNPVRVPERMLKTIGAIKSIERRPDVINWAPNPEFRQHIDNWEVPPVDPVMPEKYPYLSYSDARAISEKKRWKKLMDMEWRRRQALVGKLSYEDPSRDVRLQGFKWQTPKEWTHEEVYAMITQNGIAARPEAHQAYIENPLLPADYVNDMGVQYIEETEEFLERIGHLATLEEVYQLERGMGVEMDLVDDWDEAEESLPLTVYADDDGTADDGPAAADAGEQEGVDYDDGLLDDEGLPENYDES